MPGLGSGLQYQIRQVRREVLWCVETGKVLADDLVGRVALDTLGAAVPRSDPAGPIHRKDGVIKHALHQESIAQIRLPPLRQISGDLAEADHLPLLVTNAGNQNVRPKAAAV